MDIESLVIGVDKVQGSVCTPLVAFLTVGFKYKGLLQVVPL